MQANKTLFDLDGKVALVTGGSRGLGLDRTVSDGIVLDVRGGAHADGGFDLDAVSRAELVVLADRVEIDFQLHSGSHAISFPVKGLTVRLCLGVSDLAPCFDFRNT